MGMRYSYLVYPARTASLPWPRAADPKMTTRPTARKAVRDMSLCLWGRERGIVRGSRRCLAPRVHKRGIAQRAATAAHRPRPGPTEGTHMPLLSKPAFGPRTAIIYITIGSL